MNQCGDHEKIFCPILAINLADAAYWTDLGSRTTPSACTAIPFPQALPPKAPSSVSSKPPPA